LVVSRLVLALILCKARVGAGGLGLEVAMMKVMSKCCGSAWCGVGWRNAGRRDLGVGTRQDPGCDKGVTGV
jgi:hypothetical protein